MTLRALIFDVDGTLAETEEAHREAFNLAFADAGLNWHWSQDDYGQLLRTTGGKERIAAFQESLPGDAPRLGPEQIATLHAAKTAIYTGLLRSGGLALREGVADLIEAARSAGLRLAIATTTSRANIDALCRCCWGCDAYQMFDVIAAGDEVAAKKPAPDVFRLALHRLDLPATAAIALEDSAAGLQSAKAAGLRVIITPATYTATHDFSAADHVVPSLSARNLAVIPELGFSRV